MGRLFGTDGVRGRVTQVGCELDGEVVAEAAANPVGAE
jgi:hypothetical protein